MIQLQSANITDGDSRQSIKKTLFAYSTESKMKEPQEIAIKNCFYLFGTVAYMHTYNLMHIPCVEIM